MINPDEKVCLNCSTPLTGKFCSDCGQKQIEPNERTLKHFIYQFFGSAFFLENNFLKNIWVLITKPGLHTLDYMEGRRKRWMAPFSLFLLINLVYFILSPLSDFSLSLSNQVTLQPHSPLAKSMVDGRLADRKISFEQYSKEYQSQSDGLTKTLIILNAPISAFFFMVWFFRRKYFFADHFVFFIHFYAFLLLSAILMLGLAWILYLMNLIDSGGGIFFYLLIASILYYMILALKRVYHLRFFKLILSICFSIVTVAVTHLAYRFILFLVTFWTT